VVAPRIVRAPSPAPPTAVVPTVSNAVVTAPPAPRHRAHAPARHPVVARPAAHPISLAFVLGILPSDLFRVPQAAGAVSHPDGVLLLLSSVAMGVLAAASFAMLRRLRRLAGAV
jgi:hypothetical protein